MTFEFRNYPPLLVSRKPTPYFSLEEKFAFYSGKKWFFSQKGVLTVCLRKREVSEKMDVFCNPSSSFLNHDCINVSYGWSFCFALIFSCTLQLCSKVMVLLLLKIGSKSEMWMNSCATSFDHSVLINFINSYRTRVAHQNFLLSFK